MRTDKPAYLIPSIEEIEAYPWNGYTVVSTFSGAGGSCLGYRMAGFKVRWASEFIPAAQEVYRLNHLNSILGTRDIRQVLPQDILDATGLSVGEIDILDGSPPCASFSTAGKREKSWGEVKQYSDTKQRVDDLFFEYVRILGGLQPKVFVAENVSGLVKGTAKGYFKIILAAMKECGYQVKARVLDAQWLGVPQIRKRVIFIGVRNDLGLQPAHPNPLSYRYTVGEAIPSIFSFEAGDGFGKMRIANAAQEVYPTVGVAASSGNGLATKVIHDVSSQYSVGDITNRPANTITQNSYHWRIEGSDGRRRLTIDELKRICSFPDDFQLTGTYAQQWERLGRAVPPIMMRAIAATIRDEILCKIM